MSQTRPTTRRRPVPAALAGPASPRLGLALLVIATAQLMVLLDATIVNVALPHIQRALGFSGSGLEWVVNAYALAFGGLMLLAGGAVGLIAGGLLTTYLSWRWVLFVNVPIGLTAALAAPRVLRESRRQRGRFDLPGAVTATGGLAALVYGLAN